MIFVKAALLFVLIIFVVQVVIGLLVDESGRRRPLKDNLAEMKAEKFLGICCLGYLSIVVICGFVFGEMGLMPAPMGTILALAFAFIAVAVGYPKSRRDARPYRRAVAAAGAALRIVRLAEVDRAEWSEVIQKNLRRVADCGLAGDRAIEIILKPGWRKKSGAFIQVIEAHAALRPLEPAADPAGGPEAVGYIGRLPHKLTADFLAWRDSGLEPTVTLESVYDIWWSGMLGRSWPSPCRRKTRRHPDPLPNLAFPLSHGHKKSRCNSGLKLLTKRHRKPPGQKISRSPVCGIAGSSLKRPLKKIVSLTKACLTNTFPNQHRSPGPSGASTGVQGILSPGGVWGGAPY